MSTHTSKHSDRKYLIIGLILMLFLFMRFLNLHDAVQFGSDAGRDFLRVWEIYSEKEVTLIGPPSEYKFNGREFYFGPAPYYTVLPALLVGNWDPLFVSYFLILLNCLVLLAVLLMLWKYHNDKKVVYTFGFLASVTPAFIAYSQSYWNPFFMLPVSTLLLALLVKSKTSTSLILFFFVGFLFGLGMQYHYSFIFAILIGFGWLWKTNKLTFRTLAAILVGGVVGFLAVILFELRNNFYNINTFILALSNPSTLGEAKFQTFYLISVFPFLLYLVSISLAKVKNSKVYFGVLLLSVLLMYFGTLTNPKPELSYPTLAKIATVINNDHPSNFNIVDQLTNDNRAMALRYLLTVKGNEPQGVEEYPTAQMLYVYSKQPLSELTNEPVWEIKSFLPVTEISTRKVNDITVYKLEK